MIIYTKQHIECHMLQEPSLFQLGTKIHHQVLHINYHQWLLHIGLLEPLRFLSQNDYESPVSFGLLSEQPQIYFTKLDWKMRNKQIKFIVLPALQFDCEQNCPNRRNDHRTRKVFLGVLVCMHNPDRGASSEYECLNSKGRIQLS